MSAPFKPWEGKEFTMNQSTSGVEPIFGGMLGSQSADAPSTANIVNSGIRPAVTSFGPGPVPPPLPNRGLQRNAVQPSMAPPLSRYMNGYQSMGMGGYPYSGYGSLGGYPRRMMGGYGMGYSGFGGYQDDFDASMMHAIDESCQTLFGPFDALVRSFGSIAMVLDSTHQAMQFSFRTVLSAADSLSKLKTIIIELASSFSIIRLFKSLYYKILRLLGILNGTTMKEKEWSEVFNKAGESITSLDGNTQQGKPSPWLALGFFSLMMGGPYLMFKLFAQSIKSGQPSKNGLKVGNDCVDAIAGFDFDAASPQELSMRRGDRLKISKTNFNHHWALATNGASTGFVPTNRLQIPSVRVKYRKPVPASYDQRNVIYQPGDCNTETSFVPENNISSVPVQPINTPAKTFSENSSDKQ